MDRYRIEGCEIHGIDVVVDNSCLGRWCRDNNVLALESALVNAKARNAELEAENERLREQKDGTYTERDSLVATLSKLLPSWLERHPDDDVDWEDDWRWIVFIDPPSGQMSWHIHDSELGWFDHLTRSGANRWDGHTTEEKYQRLAALAKPGEEGG